MKRATKEQIAEARRLAEEGRSPSAIVEETGVCLQTASMIVRQVGEPPVTTRKMTGEEMEKYGVKAKVEAKTEQAVAPTANEHERQAEIKINALPVGMLVNEAEKMARAFNFLHIDKVEVVIR